MAVLPTKFAPAGKSEKERIANIEAYIKYLEERLEHFASVTNKKIEEVNKNVNDN